MLADGQAAYPPSKSQEQKWKDGADYNAQLGGTTQMSTVNKATGEVTPGPVKRAYFKPVSRQEFGEGPGRGGYGSYRAPRTDPGKWRMANTQVSKTTRIPPGQ